MKGLGWDMASRRTLETLAFFPPCSRMEGFGLYVGVLPRVPSACSSVFTSKPVSWWRLLTGEECVTGQLTPCLVCSSPGSLFMALTKDQPRTGLCSHHLISFSQ